MAEVIGELIQYSSFFQWEWRIPAFLSLPGEVGKLYRSRTFFFSGAYWELELFPNGEAKECEGWVALYLHRAAIGPSLTVGYTMGVRKADGDEETRFEEDGYRFSEADSWGTDEFLQRNDLVQQRAVLAPSELLTVTFTLKNDCRHSMQESLFKRLWNTSIMLQGILTSEEGADVTFKLEDGEVRAHKLMLKARSEVFTRMFSADPKESHDGEVVIPGADKESFNVVLTYMYSGVPQGLSPKNMCKVYRIARKYELGELVRLSVEFIKGSLSLQTVCDVIKLAELCQEPDLMDLAMKFVGNNVVEVRELNEWKILKKEHFSVVSELLETILANNAANIKS